MNKYILDDLYVNRTPRLYCNYAPTIRAERYGLKVIEEIEKIEEVNNDNRCTKFSEKKK